MSNRRMDEENKKHICSFPNCGKRFFHSTDLNRHQRSKHGAGLKRPGRRCQGPPGSAVYPGLVMHEGVQRAEVETADMSGLMTVGDSGCNIPPHMSPSILSPQETLPGSLETLPIKSDRGDDGAQLIIKSGDDGAQLIIKSGDDGAQVIKSDPGDDDTEDSSQS